MNTHVRSGSSLVAHARWPAAGRWWWLACLLLPAVVIAGAPIGTDSVWVQEARLTPDAAEDPGNFGEAVAIDADTLLIGVSTANVDGNFNQGAVDVFTRDTSGWGGYQRLLASDGAAADSFGRSVAVAGDLAVVGAPGVTVGDNNSHGAVYVFVRDGGSWSEQSRLVADDDEVGGFGRAVAIADDGNVVLVGAPNADPDDVFNQGAVYAYTRDGDGWSDPVRLTAADGAQSDQFGITLAAHGSTALVGAYFANIGDHSSQGAAYVLELDGGDWVEQAKLVASDGAQTDFFGQAVAVTADTAFVGVRSADIDGNSSQGATYVFTRQDGVWGEQSKLIAPDGARFDNFGAALAVSGDTLLIGAIGVDVAGEHATGVVYRYIREDGEWRYRSRFGDGEARSFGAGLAIEPGTVVIGAPGGIPAPGVSVPPAAYVYHAVEPDSDQIAVEGVVRSLGHCGSEPAMAPEAVVEIAGAEGTITLDTDTVGRYHALVPAGQGPLTITVTLPTHLPWVFEDFDPAGGESWMVDADLVLDAPCATAEPVEMALDLPVGTATTFDVTVGNFGGGAALDWSVGTAVSPFSAGGARIVDCDDELGLIVHDDGVVDNGYTSGNAAIDEVVFVDRFRPAQYPAAFRAVCIALFSLGPTSLDFEIVIFDDDGGQGGQTGAPGTELGALPVTAEDIPVVSPPLPPDMQPTWFKFDITALDVVIESGSMYIGARWQPVAPAEPDVVIAADQGQGNVGGGWWWNSLDQWVPMGVPSSFQPYRALFVRAAENLGGCHDPGELPWLSIGPAAGTVPAGDGDVLQATVNTHGLAPGEYLASLCIETSDPSEPLLVVPVRLTVNQDQVAPGVLATDPEHTVFGDVTVGESQAATIEIENAGEPGSAALLLSELVLVGDPAFTVTGGDCAAGQVLAAGAACTVEVSFAPPAAGAAGATLNVQTADGQTADVALDGLGVDPEPPADPIFEDRFEAGPQAPL